MTCTSAPALAAWLALSSTGLAACGSPTSNTGELGPPLVRALDALAIAGATSSAPWRCGALTRTTTTHATAPTGWTLAAHVLRQSPPRARAVVAVLGDVGGGGVAAEAALTHVRTAIGAQSVDLIVSVGGLGSDQATLTRALEILVADGAVPVIAIAGDREPARALDAAVATIAGRGLPVFDGSDIRAGGVGPLTIGTLPGHVSAGRLAAGADGCGHVDDDVTALRSLLHAQGGRAVVASARAPASGDGGGAAAGVGGLDAGESRLRELLLAPMIDGGTVAAVIHAPLTDAEPSAGQRTDDDPMVVLPVPRLDPRPRASTSPTGARALVLTADENALRWDATPR